jgi:hypothetical protein
MNYWQRYDGAGTNRGIAKLTVWSAFRAIVFPAHSANSGRWAVSRMTRHTRSPTPMPNGPKPCGRDLRPTAGNRNGGIVSSDMSGVARHNWMALTPNP